MRLQHKTVTLKSGGEVTVDGQESSVLPRLVSTDQGHVLISRASSSYVTGDGQQSLRTYCCTASYTYACV